MKETALSACEKEFVPKAISEGRRLDTRNLLEYRQLEIVYGGDWGCCLVSLGNTKVLAQVSCEIQQPKTTRPNEGILYINVDFSPMGAPHFEPGRPSDAAVQCNRLLEKCIKESRCIDLESLCIVSDEKVWQVRVDLSVLNHDGALVDAASVAALAALAHFRRPDVTIDGEEVVVHRDPAERDFLPLSLHHHPICISFALFNGGRDVVVDPVVLEERTAEAQVVVGINAYRELTALHLGGTSSPATNQLVMHCSSLAALRAVEVVRMIKDTLSKDTEARLQRSTVGFVQCINLEKVTTLSHDAMVTALGQLNMDMKMEDNGDEHETDSEDDGSKSPLANMVVESAGMNSAELVPEGSRKLEDSLPHHKDIIGEGGPSTWESQVKESEDSESEEEEAEIQVVAQVSRTSKVKGPVEEIELSGGSEEDDVVTLQPEEMNLDKEYNGSTSSQLNGTSKSERRQSRKKSKNIVCE